MSVIELAPTGTTRRARVGGAADPAARTAATRGRARTRPVPRTRPVRVARPAVAHTRRAGVACAAPVEIGAASVVVSSAVHLTRRGWTVLLGTGVAIAAVLVWIAYLSHPATPAASTAAPTGVVVQSGDTLWSIAERVAPTKDPRAVVWDLQQANHLTGVTVVPGQVLRVG